MTKREEVAKQLARELNYHISGESKFLHLPNGQECETEATEAEMLIWDALISREMRVRALEATLASIVECQVEDVDGCGACVDAARLALNSKGEKG